MRKAVAYRSASKDNYKRFCIEHSEIDLSFDEWRNILYRYVDMYREYILETGEKAKLPCGWGQFSITKQKPKKIIIKNGKERINLPIDWKKTKEKGKRIYNFNHATEGYRFRWRWFKRTAIFKHNNLWYFKANRLTARLINHYIKSDEKYQHIYLNWGK